jgi:hypothetical protein
LRVRAYVEDARWAFALSLSPDSSPSQIVQAGLVRLIENHHSASAVSPAGSVLATRRRLSELAGSVYANGYRAGLQLCNALDWAQLDSLAGEGWQQAALDSLSSSTGVESVKEDPNSATTLYRTGFRDALSNVWRGARAAVENAEGSATPTLLSY